LDRGIRPRKAKARILDQTVAISAMMIKGSEVRKADHQIEPLLLDRWPPRAMSGEEISREEFDATLRSRSLGAFII
jgi:hypothetical protein